MAQVSTAYYVAATREVAKTITEKCQVLGTMLETSQTKFRSAQQIAHDTIFQQTPLVEEMNRVFKHLQSIRVDPTMVGGEHGKTLFDFVDADTVQSLQQDAIEQTKEIEELLAAHQYALKRITAIYQFFLPFETRYKNDIEALELENADASSPDRSKQIEHLYNTAVNCFVDMEQCDRFLLRYFTTINDIYPHYETIFADAQSLFDELHSLRDFYHHFLGSYEKVGPELERRQQYERNVSRLIEETRSKLAALEEEESNLRVAFCEDHARFLPSSLCPEIKYLPDQFEIVRVDEDNGCQPPANEQ